MKADEGEGPVSRHGVFTLDEMPPRYYLYRRLGGSRSRSGRYGEEEDLSPLP
jgi:hypothetical protein